MNRRRTRLSAAIVAGAALVFVIALTTIGEATHTPANKVWVAASTLEVMAQTATEGVVEKPDEVVLAVGKAKYSAPQDLRISASSECALWTNTATTGDDDSESKARVEIWVTIDGNVVPVSAGDPAGSASGDTGSAGRGRVVICNRAARMKTEQIEAAQGEPVCPPVPNAPCLPNDDADQEDDIIIRSYNRTRSANGFNWGVLNVGSYDVEGIPAGTKNGVVEIQLHARLVAELTDEDDSDNDEDDFSPGALAAVGKRTLFVEPVKMANDADF